jgi:hypothetical protein
MDAMTDMVAGVKNEKRMVNGWYNSTVQWLTCPWGL